MQRPPAIILMNYVKTTSTYQVLGDGSPFPKEVLYDIEVTVAGGPVEGRVSLLHVIKHT